MFEDVNSNSCRSSVIPAPVLRSITKDECPESFFKKDSRLASLAGMTNDCSLYTDSDYTRNICYLYLLDFTVNI